MMHVRGGADWRQEVMFSSGAFEKSRLMPSSTSYLLMLMRTPKIMIQWTISWIIERRKIRIITVRAATINGHIFPRFSSQWMEFLVTRL